MPDRRTRPSTVAGLRPLLPLAASWLAGSALLLVVIRQEVIPREQLLLDPSSYSRVPWYAGMVSSFGILGWTTATVAAAAGAWIARIGDRPPAACLLRGGSLLSALLLLDDLFQLHIVVTGTLDIGKVDVYLIYLGLGSWWAITNRREAWRTRWPLLVAAVAALAGSAIADQVGPASETGVVVEDSLKFLGILAWAQYFAVTGRDIAASIVAGEEDTTGPGHAGAGPSAARPRVVAGRHDGENASMAAAGAGGDETARPTRPGGRT